MYFDASERIARNTDHSRSLIEKIDAFLARPRVKQFEIEQLKEKAQIGLTDNIAPILDEYVRAKVLKKPQNIYLCPQHAKSLEKINQREGRCIDCEKIYAFEDCPSKLIYRRIREPDRVLIESDKKVVPQTATIQTKWWKDSRFIVGIIVTIIVGLITFAGSILGGDTIIINYPTNDTATILNTSQPTSEATLIATETIEATVELTAEITPEITPEVSSESSD